MQHTRFWMGFFDQQLNNTQGDARFCLKTFLGRRAFTARHQVFLDGTVVGLDRSDRHLRSAEH